jgi:uncharacterized LabA/DUF88 family protein
MTTRNPQEDRIFLREVLQTTFRSKGNQEEVYPLLQANIDKLDGSFAQLFGKWVSANLRAAEPAQARGMAQRIVKLCYLVQQFPQGNQTANLAIAIAGYEACLQTLTRDAFPQDWASTQEALDLAYKQRQQLIESAATETSTDSDIAQLKQQIAATQNNLKTLTEQFQQLLQTTQQIEQLKTAIAQLNQQAASPVPQQDLTPLISAIKELQQQNALQESTKPAANQAPGQYFNTAIFYDIENLTNGYALSKDLIADLSLNRILQLIKQTKKIGHIASQRAYANWGHPILGQMRREILHLGIEPIQTFGFGIFHQRNAADIQLTIDAMECAHLRSSIQVFVIVSGDGAFASLANKLHQYGKTVVGCAYREAINPILEAVCDAFVLIPNPKPREQEEASINSLEEREDNSSSTPKARDRRSEEIIAQTKEVLHSIEADTEYNTRLVQEGILMPRVHQILKTKIPDFDEKYRQAGFLTLKPFLTAVCEGTKFYLAQNEPSKLLIRGITPTDSNASLAYISSDIEEVHSVETYLAILSTGHPIFKPPSPEDLRQVARYLAKNPFQSETLGEKIEKLVNILGKQVNQQSIKNSLLAFLSAGCFTREPDGVPLAVQNLALKQKFQSVELLLEALREGIESKLKTRLSEIDGNILRQIIPLNDHTTEDAEHGIEE